MGGIGKSYRGIADADLISWNQDQASIIIQFQRSDTQQQLKIILSRTAKKELWVNETKVPQKELVGTLNEVLFSPDDLQLIKGSPSQRRRFLDLELSQTSALYYNQLSMYNRALQQRNFILREQAGSRKISLGEWDTQLAETGSYLIKKRLAGLKKLNLLLDLMNRRLTGGKENLRITYEQPYSDGELLVEPADLLAKLQETLPIDRRRQSTTIGPHRDDLGFFSGAADLRKYGSQGQQRTAVLSLKLSELEFIKSETTEYPILLLDDVMSELDEKRREKMVVFFRNKNIQTFITATDASMFDNIEGASLYNVSSGNAEAMK